MKTFTLRITLLTFVLSLLLAPALIAQDTCTPTGQMAENITAHTVDLSWENPDNPTWVRYYPTGTQQYKFKFANLNDAVSLVCLLPETEYTWELNTFCDSVWSGYNWPQIFTTLEDTVVCEPTNQLAENITAHSVDLSWGNLDGLTWVRYYPAGTQQYRYKYAQLNNAVNLTWLQSETEYIWEINTNCSGAWSGYDWALTFTTPQDTVSCEPSEQMADNITAFSADLFWENLDGSTWVRYYPTGTQEYRYRFANEGNEVSLSWLQPETEYTWEINTLCNGQWTGYDWAQSFTTIEDTIVCEPLNQIAENITAHTADLSWEGLTGPTWVRFFETGTSQYKYRYADMNNSVGLQCLNDNVEYTWELNTMCNGIWSGFDWPQTFTTLEDTIVCEPLNQIAENITANSADLSWEGLTDLTWVRYFKTGSSQYRYSFADTNNNTTLLFLEGDTEYNWEINTKCNGMWTGYNWLQVFVTPEDTATIICEPANLQAENITAFSADLSWEDTQGSTYIRYFVAGTQQYSYAFTTENMVNIENLFAETDYEWELNIFCQGEWTGYNTTAAFTTLAENKANSEQYSFKMSNTEVSQFTGLSMFPNPTNQKTIMTFNSDVVGEYSISVLNILGNVVIEKSKISSDGLNTVTLDLSNQEKGIYFVILRQANKMEKFKLIKK